MTTFTSDDREEAYKKIVEAAPNQPGYEDAVPIPFAGWVSNDLTDQEIMELWVKHLLDDIPVFARAVIRRAQER